MDPTKRSVISFRIEIDVLAVTFAPFEVISPFGVPLFLFR
jgi:hypothetical protein